MGQECPNSTITATAPLHHRVRYVDDEQLPGRAWVMIHDHDAVYLVLRASSVCPQVLEEAWAAYRLLLNRKQLAA